MIRVISLGVGGLVVACAALGFAHASGQASLTVGAEVASGCGALLGPTLTKAGSALPLALTVSCPRGIAFMVMPQGVGALSVGQAYMSRGAEGAVTQAIAAPHTLGNGFIDERQSVRLVTVEY